LIHLQTGHAPLSGYLNHIGKTPLDRCPTCWKHLCEHIQEMVQHYMLDCPVYARERSILDCKLGHNARNFKYLVSSKKGIKVLSIYVAHTKQLDLTSQR
ncbi:hypothetical protein BDQ12DRAFT_618686, partial [Crucibulum laeve]